MVRSGSAHGARRQGGQIFFLALPLLVACSQRNLTPIGPGSLYEPDEEERELWAAVREEVAQLEGSEDRLPNPELESYIDGVITRVLSGNRTAYQPLEFRVFIVDSDTVNAAAYPTGDIIIHKGILGRMRNEAQLAMLLGHEITHATHRHTYQRFEDAEDKRIAMTFLKIAAGFGGGIVSTAVSTVGGIATEASIAGYGRDLEREADRVGLTRVGQAGYDPQAAVQLWQQMLDASGKKSSGLLYMYASHPRMQERLTTSRELSRQLPPALVNGARDVGAERYFARAWPFILDEAARHIAQSRFALAEATLTYLREQRPQDPVFLAWTGWLYIQRGEQGDAGRAREAYRAALTLRPDYADALFELGSYEAEHGDAAAARPLLERFLGVEPAGERAGRARTLLQDL